VVNRRDITGDALVEAELQLAVVIAEFGSTSTRPPTLPARSRRARQREQLAAAGPGRATTAAGAMRAQ
jgi:hypothetical protein